MAMFSIYPLEGDQTLLMQESGAPVPVQWEEIKSLPAV